MTDRMIAGRRIWHYENGVLREKTDPVVTEHPVTIILNGEEFATLVCSPEHIDEMAVGFLASEGVISAYADLQNLACDIDNGFIYAEVVRLNPFRAQSHSKRYVGSCCGKSRQDYYFWSDARTVKPIAAREARLTPDDCFLLMAAVQSCSETFRDTGGVHNAALCDRSGILLARTDIGRHNALDKIYGRCLMDGGSCSGKTIAFSGRVSSEVLLKSAKIGAEIVLSKSAPTELALRMADNLGMTVVGFIRGQSFNVYTHPERIAPARF